VPAAKDDPDKYFQRQWALEVIKRALQSLRAEFQASDRLAEFEAISLYLSAGGKDAPSHADLAIRLSISETDVNNRVHRLRQRYRELILEEVRSYSDSEEEAQQESGTCSRLRLANRLDSSLVYLGSRVAICRVNATNVLKLGILPL
jgi:RNA polymerase sigma-70 factor (ECF subfamily)